LKYSLCKYLKLATHLYVILCKWQKISYLFLYTHCNMDKNCCCQGLACVKLYFKQGFLNNYKNNLHPWGYFCVISYFLHALWFLRVKTWMAHTRQHSESGFHISVNWGQFVHLPLFLNRGLEVLKILNLKSTDIREIKLSLN
jgi:hypothetical protein